MDRTKQRIHEVDTRIRTERIRPLFTFQHHLDIDTSSALQTLHQKLLNPEASDSQWLVGQPTSQLSSEVDKPYVKLIYTIHGSQGTSDAHLTEQGLVLQGHWWYRGEIQVQPQATGCQLSYRVYNIAPRTSRMLVWFMYISLRRQAQATFAALITAMHPVV